ncbi:MAG: hypothetical protein AAGE76_00715 [Pseudomonadota bacterium]
MNLIELTTPPVAALPVRAFADHLRLGSGFADDGSQDPVLIAFLRAAMAAIEGRTGKIVLERDFSWELTRWFSLDRQGLPVGPVSAVREVALVQADGTATVVDPSAYTLRKDVYRPELRAAALPTIPTGGTVRISFTAGFGASWEAIPPDLAQAVFLLAASNYEGRAEAAGRGATMPFGVLSLIERYKTVRLLGDVL